MSFQFQTNQEDIEEWVHEIKTPLSLMTLLLENRNSEMSNYVFHRMDHIKQEISEDIDRILYYARLQKAHVDYHMTPVILENIVEDLILEYNTFIQEKNIDIHCQILDSAVLTDKKFIYFILSQILSNAFKYTENSIFIEIHRHEDTKQVECTIYDNGQGVASEDLPFIFDKGFTGNSSKRQRATGLGLYLVAKYCHELKIQIGVSDHIPEQYHFGIQLIFPYITKS